MMKYLREKITSRLGDDLPLNDNIPSIQQIYSQNSLNDSVSININSNANDIICNDQTTSEVEKLTAAGVNITSGRRLISSSSPVIIPQKPVYSNASSQSPSSYTSVGDQMSSMGETLLQSHREVDDALCTSLPMLPSTSQQLEHSAARDRIAVKNKLRQPTKQKLSTLKEMEDKQTDLFSSISTYEQTSSLPETESKVQLQPIVDLVDLDAARSRLRIHSPDKFHSIRPITPTHVSSIQHSRSFKRSQDIKTITQPITKTLDEEEEAEEDEEERENTNQSISFSSSEEHIYDNLDLFKRHKTQVTSDVVFNANQSSTNLMVKTREHSTLTTTRIRPVTVHMSSNNDQQLVNEFENVFNQLKKRSSSKPALPKHEPIPRPLPPPAEAVPITVSLEEDTSAPLLAENVPMVPKVISTNKIIEIPSITPLPNRRKTVGGVHLPANNKVAATDMKPAVSWIDIAKQKQNKFQSISQDQHQQEESEQQQTSPIEPIMISRKQVTISSNLSIVKENTSDDIRSNRKSMFEPAVTQRRLSPSTPPPNAIERDSIRALKADKPNRINNLIQFFDK